MTFIDIKPFIVKRLRLKQNQASRKIRLGCGMFFLLFHVFFMAQPALADKNIRQFDNSAKEKQYRLLIKELRCPKCQNQNLASSHSPIAQNLKQKTYELVQQGKSNAQIRQYMIARYGDFISYRPPVNKATLILWFLPFFLLLIIGIWWIKSRPEKTAKAMTLADDEKAQLQHILKQYSQKSTKN